MGTIILIVAFVIEAAFVTYCLITKSNQKKVRSFVRIGAFVAFVLFTLAAVIQWGSGWYLLALLLFIWAMIGAVTLLRKKAEKKEYKPGRLVFNGILVMLLVFIAVTPALIFPQHKAPAVTGKFAVATVKYTYTDPSRIETFSKTGGNREVNVEFWYPKDGSGAYPLIVFSHGSLGVKTSNVSTFIDLASNGYVVCSIDHPYLSLFTTGADGHMVTADPSYMQEFMDSNNGKYDEATEYKIEQKWMAVRTSDISFTLDTILKNVKDSASGEVYQQIDPQKIGLIGHSLGGAAVAQVARQRNDIGAVINLDADLLGEYLDYVNGKYVMNDKVYPVPLLTIFADDMVKLMAAIPDANTVIAVKHVIATAPNAYEVHLTGTNHLSLTDMALSSPLLVSMITASVPKAGGQMTNALATIEKMNAITLQFFNVYLKGEGSFTSSGTY